MTTREKHNGFLMIPGPTPVVPRILSALSEPTIAHTSPELATIVQRCQEGVRLVCGTEDAHVFYLPARERWRRRRQWSM